jgi:putative colanic acid biosynthesis acetyltransferase WcaF
MGTHRRFATVVCPRRDLNTLKAVENTTLDVAGNRQARKYGAREMGLRVLWSIVWPLFRFSPRPLFGLRRALLRLLGARVGTDVHIYPSARIYFPWMLEIGNESSIGEDALIYNLGKVAIGARSTISHRAHICAGTHDYEDPLLPLLRPPIVIQDDTWICADAFVGPNVVVGKGAVVGARAAVFSNVEPWTVVGGNPAKVLKMRVLGAENVSSSINESASQIK